MFSSATKTAARLGLKRGASGFNSCIFVGSLSEDNSIGYKCCIGLSNTPLPRLYSHCTHHTIFSWKYLLHNCTQLTTILCFGQLDQDNISFIYFKSFTMVFQTVFLSERCHILFSPAGPKRIFTQSILSHPLLPSPLEKFLPHYRSLSSNFSSSLVRCKWRYDVDVHISGNSPC